MTKRGHLLPKSTRAVPGPEDDAGFALPVHYVRAIADQVRSRGVDLDRWLAEGDLSQTRLLDPSLAIGYRAFERLVRSSLEVTREPALGLFVGERLLASTHGVLGYAATTSGTIRQALELLERFVRLRTPMVSVSHATASQLIRVRIQETRPLGDIRRPVLEAVVMSVKKVLDSISSGACQVTEVAFPFDAPEYASVARDLFGCDVRYGRTWAGFTLLADVMDQPLPKADPEAFRLTTLICQRELEKLTADESLAAQMRRLLLETQGGFPSLQVAARLVRMTPRTLHRRLVEEGTSYSDLLDEIRHALAVEHVKSGRFSVEKIAYTLGYSDLANFRRAFKRWEGVAPSEYRAARTGARVPAQGSSRASPKR